MVARRVSIVKLLYNLLHSRTDWRTLINMEKTDTKTIGDLIIARRMELGSPKHPRGLRAVALEIGVSQGTISRVENGGDPDLSTFRKLCDWLGLGADEIAALVKVEKKETETNG